MIFHLLLQHRDMKYRDLQLISYIANYLGYSIRSNIPGTKFPLLPDLITSFILETFKYNQPSTSNYKDLLLICV